MGPLLDALRALGGKASPRDCTDWIANKLNLPAAVLEARTKTDVPRYYNQVAWARQYLVWEGLLESTRHGVWSLTSKGAATHLNEETSRALFLDRVKVYSNTRKKKSLIPSPVIAEALEEAEAPDIKEEQELIGVLLSLPPDGFERLCKRLLHEYGFERVEVLGKSHDGGIDGRGVLRLNAFVSMKVMFQCKRVRGSVSRAQLGDFRNATMGRAEKGIFLTTGTFSSDARKEAEREGVLPIELVDGERLIELFQAKQLGLRPRHTFEIDHSFFDQFR